MEILNLDKKTSEVLSLREVFYKFEDRMFDKIRLHTNMDKTNCIKYFSQKWWIMIDGWGSLIRTRPEIYDALKDAPATYVIKDNCIDIFMIEEE